MTIFTETLFSVPPIDALTEKSKDPSNKKLYNRLAKLNKTQLLKVLSSKQQRILQINSLIKALQTELDSMITGNAVNKKVMKNFIKTLNTIIKLKDNYPITETDLAQYIKNHYDI